jgi:hypothetical protein
VISYRVTYLVFDACGQATGDPEATTITVPDGHAADVEDKRLAGLDRAVQKATGAPTAVVIAARRVEPDQT